MGEVVALPGTGQGPTLRAAAEAYLLSVRVVSLETTAICHR